jgi:diacylglycerol kinase (ATP)
MQILFIVNPAAGRRKSKDIVPIIERICKENNVPYKIKYTSGPNEATEIARNGANLKFERIIAVGGDGTLNEVVNGIAGTEKALGIIPAGSGNDFIRSLGDLENIEEIIYQNIFGEVKAIDLAKCNGRYFINVGSVGFDAEVAMKAKNTKKLLTGKAAYLAAAINTLITFEGMKVKVEIDDKIIEENTLLIAIANGKYYGGGILPAPEANIEDGYFDICFVEHVPKFKILYLLPKYIKGQHHSIKEVRFYKSRKIKLTSEKKIYVNLDGEIFEDNEAEFEIIPKGINVICLTKE